MSPPARAGEHGAVAAAPRPAPTKTSPPTRTAETRTHSMRPRKPTASDSKYPSSFSEWAHLMAERPYVAPGWWAA